MFEDQDRGSLLDALRIDRQPLRHEQGQPRILIILLAGIAILAAGGSLYFHQLDQRIAVHVITAQAEDGGATTSGLDASGYVVARLQATLSAKILGKVVYLHADEGERVEKGEVVAKLDDSNYFAALREAKAQEDQTKVAFQDEGPTYSRYKELWGEHAISTDAWQNQQATYDADRMAVAVAHAATAYAQANENDTTVRAPFSGIVTDKVAQIGEIVAPSAAGGGDTRTGIATLVDMDSLEIEVDVSENYIDRVKVGGPVVARLDAYPDWDIPGSVLAIIPTADESKGTVKVRITIKSKDPRILPQMAARVSFLTTPSSLSATGRVSVPPQAVRVSGRTGTVYLVNTENKIEKREVALGLKTNDSLIILSGVSPGDRLVVGDTSGLHDGVAVKIEDQL